MQCSQEYECSTVPAHIDVEEEENKGGDSEETDIRNDLPNVLHAMNERVLIRQIRMINCANEAAHLNQWIRLFRIRIANRVDQFLI